MCMFVVPLVWKVVTEGGGEDVGTIVQLRKCFGLRGFSTNTYFKVLIFLGWGGRHYLELLLHVQYRWLKAFLRTAQRWLSTSKS